MYSDEIFIINTQAKINLNQIIIREKADGHVKIDTTNLPDPTILYITFGTALGLVIAFSLLSNMMKVTRNTLMNISQANKLPCRKCKFFSYNSYLQCALHPSIVLTPEAMNCSDYHNNNFYKE